MNPNDNQNTPQIKPQKKPTSLVISLLLLATIVIVGVAILINRNSSNPTTSTNTTENQQVTSNATLSLDPPETTVQAEKLVTLNVYVDSGDQPISSVQADIDYPEDSLTFVAIDVSDSAFSVQAESTEKDGVVYMARAQIGGLTGKQLVGKITFKQKTADTSTSQLAFADSSKVLTLSENPQNILNTKNGATLTLGE